MEQNYSTVMIPGTAADGGGSKPWSNVNNAKVEDGVTADSDLIGPGGGGGIPNDLVLSNFGFNIPPFAVIDGISVMAKVSKSGGGCSDWELGLKPNGGSYNASADSPDYGQFWPDSLDYRTWGDNTTLWDHAWTPSEINNSGFSFRISAFFGSGTGTISVDAVWITVFWHIDLETAAADVPTRVDYKVYSRDGTYLGLLPNVSSPFGFSQDINSAGSTIEIVCGEKAENATTTDPILTESDLPIQTESSLSILATNTEILIATGDSPDNAIFKNSNRLKVWVYDYWHPNGKLMFSGQINKVGFSYGSGNSSVKLQVISDGVDLNNFIARGYPFSYSTDVTQNSQNGYVTVTQASKGAGWLRYGQSWIVSAGITNIGAIVLKLQGTATVTITVYDGPDGVIIGSITKSVANGSAADVQFELSQLLTAVPLDEYFFGVSVASGQSIKVYKHGTSSTYANGSMYESSYGGGSGGGSYAPVAGDLYFITKYGTPTTTATYSSQDPVTDMMSGILLDYNGRGGYVTERDFEATGLSLSYTFIMASIYEALRKALELSPTGYYSYIDLGTAEMDIKQQTETPDFTIVRGKDVNMLDLVLSIENVKNYLLFTGGETAPNVNLYRDYQDSESASLYGLRTVARSDNRVTAAATADAIGDTFIATEADETQETSVTIPITAMDISLLIPGKNIGFRNFGNFIDSMVLQIVRRDYTTKAVTLSLGRLPVRMNDQIQRINRGLLNEQTINNPTAPT